jgi:hypothetical protein
VLKLLGSPGWMRFVLQERPGIPVFHLIRHPGGFLNSWSRRYLASQDRNEVTRLNRQRLHEVARINPLWAERLEGIDVMSAEEAELWNWLYVNEAVYQAGRASGQYHRVVYEDLVRDTVSTVKFLYAACGLVWTEGIEQAIESSSSGSKFIAAAWRERLQPEQQELVERFLEAALSFYPPLRKDLGRDETFG